MVKSNLATELYLQSDFCLLLFKYLLCEDDIKGIQLFLDIVEVFLLMLADVITWLSDTVIGLQNLNLLHRF